MKRIYVVLVVVFSLMFAPTSSAHVLVTDTSGNTGAVLHIISDDDPVAGEVSSMYFDLQDTVVAEKVQSVTVSIANDKNKVDSIDLKLDDSLATAKYTFLLQGRYVMTFTVKTQSRTYVYEQTQRVSRGVKSGAVTQTRYVWAEAALIGSIAACMVGCILLWNHRKELWRVSTF